jgi:hypothetical protein
MVLPTYLGPVQGGILLSSNFARGHTATSTTVTMPVQQHDDYAGAPEETTVVETLR